MLSWLLSKFGSARVLNPVPTTADLPVDVKYVLEYHFTIIGNDDTVNNTHMKAGRPPEAPISDKGILEKWHTVG